MFIGRFSHSLDSKGRVSLPSSFRTVLEERYGSEKVYVTIWKEREGDFWKKILHVYPADEFEILQDRIAEGSQFDPRLNDFRRIYVSGASSALPDKQGRIGLTGEQRTFAGLTKDVVVLGTGLKRIEIWDRGAWEAWNGRHEDEVFEGIGDVLKDMGL